MVDPEHLKTLGTNELRKSKNFLKTFAYEEARQNGTADTLERINASVAKIDHELNRRANEQAGFNRTL